MSQPATPRRANLLRTPSSLPVSARVLYHSWASLTVFLHIGTGSWQARPRLSACGNISPWAGFSSSVPTTPDR